jgi:hypothetical protein
MSLAAAPSVYARRDAKRPVPAWRRLLSFHFASAPDGTACTLGRRVVAVLAVARGSIPIAGSSGVIGELRPTRGVGLRRCEESVPDARPKGDGQVLEDRVNKMGLIVIVWSGA